MYKLSDDVMLHQENENQFLVNTNTGKVFQLNDIALMIVAGLDGSKSIEDIKHNISAQFIDVDYEQINSDVDSYINLLVESQSIVKSA